LLAYAEQKAAEPTIQKRPPSWFTDATSDESQSVSKAQSHVTSPATLISMKDEILVQILQFVDFATKMKFRQVCRRTESLLTSQASRSLFKEVDLSPWNKKMTDSFFVPISMFLESRVKLLELTNCFHLTFKSFKAMSEYNSRLTHLNLHSCWELTDNSLASLATGCPYLKDIDLSNCRKITDRGIYALFSTARQNISGDEELASNLSEMSVDGNSAASTPPASTGITRIALSYCKNLTDMSMRYMADFGAETLVFINFQRCTTITDAGFETWEPGSFKCLESVILNDCTFLTDRAISSLVRAAPNIRYISLSFCCALTDNSIEFLAQHLKQLEHIDASYCGAAVSDASVAVLVQEGLPNLKEIIVRGCVRVTDSSVYALLAIARQLHLLNISQCQSVTMETKSMLQHYQDDGEGCPQVLV
jgi:F-box/leucine-rich repeat protein 7